MNGTLVGLALALMALSTPVFGAEDIIWVEAEDCVEKEVVPNAPMDAVSPAELSGGDWLCSYAHKGQPTGRAAYEFTVPREGQYHFWVRAALGTGLSYRLDDAEEATAVPKGKGVDPMPIAADGNYHWPPHVSWYDLGTVELEAGGHRITWYLGGMAGEERQGGMDCFVLSAGEFVPRGKYRPGEEAPEPGPEFPTEDSWAFTPDEDAFSPDAVIDLRPLNEEFAGEHGFIRLSEDGDSFVRGDGRPIRFWAAGLRTSWPGTRDLEDMRRIARFLAKRGVNAVRVFISIPPPEADSKIGDVKEQELDMLFKLTAALKEEGIYLVVDAYWPTATSIHPGWGLDARSGKPVGLAFFDPKMQKVYKAWMREIYTRENPYTGVRLADDPAIAVIQLQNEDSLLWWQFHSIKGEPLELLRNLYADFLQTKYGSLEKARDAWKGYPAEYPADEWDRGLPGFVHVWDFTRDAMAEKSDIPGYWSRTADQLEFLARTMRNFNADMADYLRDELGCRQLINANNWRTVDLVTAQDAEYWAQCANDVIARNIYTGGKHAGPGNGSSIRENHVYTNACLIREAHRLATNVKQPTGHPFILPECLWPPPNLYQSEAPLMIAGQMSLTGLDMACWFCNWPGEWSASPTTKWTYSTPMQIGQWPAAALLYRKGYLDAGEPAVVEHRSLEEMWQHRLPIIGEEPGWDPNRDEGIAAFQSDVETAVDPLAYLVGPVRASYGSDSPDKVIPLDEYINRGRKTVRSVTGQIETDYGRGIYRVDAPRVQAVSGFLGDAGPQRLSDVEIDCANRYATVIVVSMDGRPLQESGKVLVQVGTLDRPTGWATRPYQLAGEQGHLIVSTGSLPRLVEKAEGTITIVNPGLATATVLDANGMRRGAPEPLRREGGRAVVPLPENALYVILERRPAR